MNLEKYEWYYLVNRYSSNEITKEEYEELHKQWTSCPIKKEEYILLFWGKFKSRYGYPSDFSFVVYIHPPKGKLKRVLAHFISKVRCMLVRIQLVCLTKTWPLSKWFIITKKAK